ncbi:hypothetical protein K440DRAFT_656861 [Wilcoxina mikolae CBS 423.85]|nr:hypothetical protein K440DRAFT_656861 [Wilcoxina mikolae CBS 423.85]
MFVGHLDDLVSGRCVVERDVRPTQEVQEKRMKESGGEKHELKERELKSLVHTVYVFTFVHSPSSPIHVPHSEAKTSEGVFAQIGHSKDIELYDHESPFTLVIAGIHGVPRETTDYLHLATLAEIHHDGLSTRDDTRRDLSRARGVSSIYGSAACRLVTY